MQLEPEEYNELPDFVQIEARPKEKLPKFKKATYSNFPLNDVPPKDNERYLYIDYRTY